MGRGVALRLASGTECLATECARCYGERVLSFGETRENPLKKTYEPMTVQELGDVRSLTQGGSGPRNDNGSRRPRRQNDDD